MLAELFRTEAKARVEPIRPQPEAAYAARQRLRALRDDLLAAIPRRPRRGGEPPVFFFDPDRQAELEAAQNTDREAVDPFAERIEAEIAALCESVEVRQMARAIPGMREAISRGKYTALAALLAVPDDEIVLVLHPNERWGCRLAVRGIDSMNPFQVLMLDAVGAESDYVPRLPGRFAAAGMAAGPAIPAGVPMLAELPYQLLRPEALHSDGTVPSGFAACPHWLWGWEPLASVPRLDGERIVLLGEPVFPLSWEVERRFPAMAAEATVIQML
ncbi:MAG TPA: hypothetical protein VGI99_11255, partial [Gemmataceae bacterium]